MDKIETIEIYLKNQIEKCDRIIQIMEMKLETAHTIETTRKREILTDVYIYIKGLQD